MRYAMLAILPALALGCGAKQEPPKEPPAPATAAHDQAK
jgi:hypothetical protein